MKVSFENKVIELFEDQAFIPHSSDNSSNYDYEYLAEENNQSFASKIGIRVWDENEKVILSSVIICEVGGATTVHDSSFLIENNAILICVCNKVDSLDVLNKKNEMGHYLKAFIGHKESLTPIREKYESSNLVSLSDEIFMIPMTDELFDEMNNLNTSPGILSFELLNENIEKITLELIGMKKLSYVESEFFGGQGGHIGIIWDNGARVYVGEFRKDTMNEILKRLGIIRTDVKDEFEIIGLNRHRHTEDWIK